MAWGPCAALREPSPSSALTDLGQVSAHRRVAPFSSGPARCAVSLAAFSELFAGLRSPSVLCAGGAWAGQTWTEFPPLTLGKCSQKNDLLRLSSSRLVLASPALLVLSTGEPAWKLSLEATGRRRVLQLPPMGCSG